MDRTERLLDLVALLLDAPNPVSWAEIRAAFPSEYGGPTSLEAAERKFERDKAELLELGIPLAFLQGDEDRDDGYVIEKDRYYLPELGLSADELAMLYAAGSAALASGAFPGSQDLAHALRKIGFFFGAGPLPTPKVRLELGGVAQVADLPDRLETLWSAISNRKSLELAYYSPRAREVTTRTVDPYGLALRRGLWSLVAYCHLRRSVRTFHVHRCNRITVNATKPRSPDFEIPASFRLDDHVAAWPWQYRFHPPVTVRLQLAGALAPLAEQLFPPAAQVTLGDLQARPVELSVSATDVGGLLRYVLSLGAEAKVTSPETAVTELQTLARRVLHAHTSGAHS